MSIELEHDINAEECQLAIKLANDIGQWLSKQDVSCDVVDGAIGIFLAQVLDNSHRNGMSLGFESGAIITITLDKAKEKEAQDDNTST